MHWNAGSIAGALVVIGLMAVAGCGGAVRSEANPTTVAGAATTAPATVATATATVTAVAAPIRPTASLATPAPGKPASPAAVTPTRSSAAPALVLKVLQPVDESVVTQAVLMVRGQTVAGAVVSVNTALANVDATGAFSASITLEDGANVIEVVASDMAGNVITQEILVVFEP